MKNKDGKLRYDLIPKGTMEAIAEVFTFIAENNLHEDNDWIENEVEDHYAALMRHLDDWWMHRHNGNVKCIDPESKLHTLKHVLTNATILLFLETSRLSQLDQHRPPLVVETQTPTPQ